MKDEEFVTKYVFKMIAGEDMEKISWEDVKLIVAGIEGVCINLDSKTQINKLHQ